MILFNNSNFNDEEVKHLKFDDDFKLELHKDKITVALGPNGIGKSSIYKNIQARKPDFGYIDYNEVESAMIKKKDNLIIASKIATIEEKENEKQVIESTIDIKGTLKDKFGLSSNPKCEAFSLNLKTYRNDIYKAFQKFSGDKLDILFSLDDDLKEFIAPYGKEIINQTIAEARIEEIKDSYKKKFLEILDNYLYGDETICPVCGNDCGESVKDIIQRTIAEINESTNKIVNDYISLNPDTNPSEVLEKVNKFKNTIVENELTIENIEDYLICGGDSEKANYILTNKTRLFELKNEIDLLENEKIEFYNHIKEIESSIREIFENQLDIPSDNIQFKDDIKELHIKLNRDITKYSTGEINLITFIVTLLEFLNSDKETLIIDDPLSSYDMPNQYKIMYEITSANEGNNYNILVLTHNIDCVNIAHSQYRGAYKIELLDEINDIIYINPLEQLIDSGFNIDYLLKRLNSRNDYNYTEYIELLSKKDGWEPDANEHKLFHYDEPYAFPNSTCNNEELVSIIDNFDGNIDNCDAIINSSNKILYLAALRVWLEKQLYSHNNEPEGLMRKKCLGEKIRFIFDGNHWTGSSKVTKRYLMNKKVMLNQNEHANSQKEPFYFALSISTDCIVKDIMDIKNHFEEE